jgi:hypothetical protein
MTIVELLPLVVVCSGGHSTTYDFARTWGTECTENTLSHNQGLLLIYRPGTTFSAAELSRPISRLPAYRARSTQKRTELKRSNRSEIPTKITLWSTYRSCLWMTSYCPGHSIMGQRTTSKHQVSRSSQSISATTILRRSTFIPILVAQPSTIYPHHQANQNEIS